MKKHFMLLCIFALFLPLLFLGCEGDTGPAGPKGDTGTPGLPGQPGTGLAAKIESCQICHNGTGERNGTGHQAIYNMYTDAGNFAVTINNVTSTVDNAAAGTYNVTMTFTITQGGQPLDNAALQALPQHTFSTTSYDNATMQFFNPVSFAANTATPTGTPGQFTVTAKSVPYAPNTTDAFVYMYVANELLNTEAEGRGHYHLYNNVLNVGQTFGNASNYVSAANVSGCEKCHGTPYRKHGYRMAEVAGLPDFVACKSCHYDNRVGGHLDWQLLVDNPQRYAEFHFGSALTDAEKAQYAYTANIMNDVHMSHSMEFPYPQSMANCATCHEGKLDTMVLTDDNFVAETCLSCHPVNGGSDTPRQSTDRNGNPITIIAYDTVNNPKQAPPLTKIWADAGVGFHNIDGQPCNDCHSVAGSAPVFSTIHTGYDPVIYADTAGNKYSDAITVTIDNASIDNNYQLRFGFSATGIAGGVSAAGIAPHVMVGLYGFDTKDFIAGPHERTIDTDRDLEYDVGAVHPRFTTVSAAPGSWEVSADLSAWSNLIAADNVTRVEIAVLPALENPALPAGDNVVALNAPSRTFDLTANAFDNTFFKPIVKVAVNENLTTSEVTGCNVCHDALGTTFHSPDRGGNIVVCRMCHITKSGGSHLEMQSRSIDSYVHAIHSFQAFDIGDIDFNDPVEEVLYDLHIEHTYPRFTIMDCESCHNANVYDVPDQSKSLPGVLSGSDFPLMGFPRNIGDVPSYITGPATRACGACHRTHAINEDNSVELEALFSHWGSFGTLVETPPNDILTVIDQIFSSL